MKNAIINTLDILVIAAIITGNANMIGVGFWAGIMAVRLIAATVKGIKEGTAKAKRIAAAK